MLFWHWNIGDLKKKNLRTKSVVINEWPPWIVTPQTPGDTFEGEAVIPLALFPKKKRYHVSEKITQSSKHPNKNILWNLE